MNQFKTLTVNGNTYTVADPNAARINDDQVSENTTWSSGKISDEIDAIIKDEQTSAATTWSSDSITRKIGEVIDDTRGSDKATWSSHNIERKIEEIIKDSGDVSIDKTWSSSKISRKIDAIINDDQVSSSNAWSSEKTKQAIDDVTEIDDEQISEQTTWSSQLVANKIDEIINDEQTSHLTTWSSKKIAAQNPVLVVECSYDIDIEEGITVFTADKHPQAVSEHLEKGGMVFINYLGEYYAFSHMDEAGCAVFSGVGAEENSVVTITVDALANVTKTTAEHGTFELIKVVEALPVEGLPNRLYLVPKTKAETQDLFDEFVWVNGAWEYITTKQIEIDLTNYVKNTDFATTTKSGVVRCGEGLSMSSSSGKINIQGATESQIRAKTTEFRPIVPSVLDYAVKVALTTNTIQLTDEEKAAARAWLGIE